MNYFKRHWDQTTGEDHTDSWGKSTYYFETDAEYFPTRQIQVFQNGKALKYDNEHISDDYGFLADQALEIEEFEPYKIDNVEFEKVWTSTQRAS